LKPLSASLCQTEILEQVSSTVSFHYLFNLCTVIALTFLDWIDKLKKPFMCKTWWFLSCVQ
jgi:hypothetical protein